MSRYVKILVSAILIIVFASFSLSAMAAGQAQEPHNHLIRPTGPFYYDVYSINADECETQKILEYECVICGLVVNAPAQDGYRKGPHEFVQIVSGLQYYMACKYCDRKLTPGIHPGV